MYLWISQLISIEEPPDNILPLPVCPKHDFDRLVPSWNKLWPSETQRCLATSLGTLIQPFCAPLALDVYLAVYFLFHVDWCSTEVWTCCVACIFIARTTWEFPWSFAPGLNNDQERGVACHVSWKHFSSLLPFSLLLSCYHPRSLYIFWNLLVEIPLIKHHLARSGMEQIERILPKEDSRAESDPRQEKIVSKAPRVSNESHRAGNAPNTIQNDQGLYVNHGRGSEGIEVLKDVSHLYIVESELPRSASGQLSEPTLEASTGSQPVARVFGLRRNLFWYIVVVVFIIFGAAFGGGVGAGLARKKHNEGGKSTDTFTAAKLVTTVVVFW